MKYKDIPIGFTRDLARQVTYGDIMRFKLLSGDENRIHWDEQFAVKTEFGRPIAYGGLILSYISCLIGNQLPGDGAVWTSVDVNFISPAYAGDSLRVVAVVAHKIDADQRIKLLIDAVNQNQETVVLATAWVKVPS